MTFWQFADAHPFVTLACAWLAAMTTMYVAYQIGGRRK